MMNENAGRQSHGQPSFQALLNQIHPDIFPLLRDHKDWQELKAQLDNQDRDSKVVTAVQGLRYTYRFRSGFEW